MNFACEISVFASKRWDRNLNVAPPSRSRRHIHPGQGCAPTPANTSRRQIEICQRSPFLNSSNGESWGPLWGSDSVFDDARKKQTCPGWMVSRSEAIHLIDPFLTADEIGDASVRTPDRDSELRIADRNLTWCQLDANDHMASFGGLLSDIYSGGVWGVGISHFFGGFCVDWVG